jgi:hypothetical protein
MTIGSCPQKPWQPVTRNSTSSVSPCFASSLRNALTTASDPRASPHVPDETMTCLGQASRWAASCFLSAAKDSCDASRRVAIDVAVASSGCFNTRLRSSQVVAWKGHLMGLGRAWRQGIVPRHRGRVAAGGSLVPSAPRHSDRYRPDPACALDDTLLQHGVGHFHEPRDVRPLDIVSHVTVLAVADTVLVDRAHDAPELLVHIVA